MIDTPNYEIIRGHVRAVSEREFWVYDLQAREVRFLVDDALVSFGVFPDHPVTIVRYGGVPVAAANHHTGQSVVWRNRDPYRRHGSGCLSLLFLIGIMASLMIGAAGGVAGLIIGVMIAWVCATGIHGIMHETDEVARHNLCVDEDLQQLLAPDPAQIQGEAQGR